MNLFPKAAEQHVAVISMHDFPQLILLFSLGYFFIWLLIYAMHYRAMQFARQLAFDRFEGMFTVKEKRGALWNTCTGLLAILCAWNSAVLAAGFCFLSIPFLLVFNEWLFRWQQNQVSKPLRKV